MRIQIGGIVLGVMMAGTTFGADQGSRPVVGLDCYHNARAATNTFRWLVER